MKIITIILSTVILNACGGTNESIAITETNNKEPIELSGTYIINTIDDNKLVSNDLTLAFDEKENKVLGFSGCNRFFGSYKIKGNTISFSNIGSTKMMCKDVMNIEQNMLKALESATKFEVDNNRLTLKKDNINILRATKQKETKLTQQSNYHIEYSGMTRGSSIFIKVKNGELTHQKDFSEKPYVMKIPQEQTFGLLSKLNKIDIKELSELKAPSNTSHYDGAMAATLKIIKDGQTYQTTTFDHGNPPKEIKELVDYILSLPKVE